MNLGLVIHSRLRSMTQAYIKNDMDARYREVINAFATLGIGD